MSETKTAATPSITYLNPSRVEQGWQGMVQIHGSGFDNGSFPLFDAAVPPSTYKSQTLLEVDVKNDITGTAGTRKVKVHTGDGGTSNEVEFTVSPKSGESQVRSS